MKLGDPFSYPDDADFTILLPFKEGGSLTPFSGRWDASLGAVRDFPSMALEHLAIIHGFPDTSFNMMSRSSRRAYLRNEARATAKEAADAAAAAAASRSAGEVGEGREGEEGEEEEDAHQQQ